MMQISLRFFERLSNSSYFIVARITPTQSWDRSDTRLYQMFFVWFSANFNILAFSTGSAAPAFFNLGLKHTGIIVIVVDTMWVVASGVSMFLRIKINDMLLAPCAEMLLTTFTSICCCSTFDYGSWGVTSPENADLWNLSSISRSCSIPAYLCVSSRLKSISWAWLILPLRLLTDAYCHWMTSLWLCINDDVISTLAARLSARNSEREAWSNADSHGGERQFSISSVDVTLFNLLWSGLLKLSCCYHSEPAQCLFHARISHLEFDCRRANTSCSLSR